MESGSLTPEATTFSTPVYAGEGVAAHETTGAILADSVTRIGAEAKGSVVASGSHGGIYPAYLVARAKARGAIFNDAAVGRDAAGIAGLAYLDALGLPAVAVSHRSARIGCSRETIEFGILTFANRAALRLGCRPGQSATTCALRMASNSPKHREPTPFREARTLLLAEANRPRVWALDSVSLVSEDDKRDVLVTGSHGALLGDRDETALKKPARAAVYNDAGGGPGERGRTRLRPLDERGIAAATIFAASARIGDGRSTYTTGRISYLNSTAVSMGGYEGMSTKEFVQLMIADR
jgi:hypothetical protein